MSEQGHRIPPIICSEFEFEGQRFQTVWWPPDEDDEYGHWDVVSADLPYIWRERQEFSEAFGV